MKGDPAIIRLDAIPDRVFEGTVTRTAYAESAESRTLRTEIDLDNADGRLRPGQFGLVTIVLARYRNRLTIPTSAIVGAPRAGGKATCFQVQHGRAVRAEIKVGVDNGKRIEVLEGLKEGGDVVADPVDGLSDGQLIDRKTTSPTSSDS